MHCPSASSFFLPEFIVVNKDFKNHRNARASPDVRRYAKRCVLSFCLEVFTLTDCMGLACDTGLAANCSVRAANRKQTPIKHVVLQHITQAYASDTD